MGRWALLPLDSENWHGEETSKYFKNFFGFGKGTLTLHLVDDALAQNAYFPKNYFEKLYNRISEINKNDYKGLEKKLLAFYDLKKQFKKAVPKISVKDYRKLSNKQLADLYQKNRDWVHRVAVFDQFAWIAEEYWPPRMRDILVKKFGLKENSEEYHRVLFALTKPEEISTTLEEKREVLEAGIAIKTKKESIQSAAKKLTKLYGWLPVFTFGVPWEEKHYFDELSALVKKNLSQLQGEYQELIDYTKTRNHDIANLIKKYQIDPKDLQVFLDFALALDTRNEGEYLISLGGFYVLPIYREIARRFAISLKQLRCLYEKEVLAALAGKIDPEKRLQEKGKYIGWGFGSDFETRVYFTAKECQQVYDQIEKKVINLQGNNEEQGVCASPGKVSGKVKVMHSPEDEEKVAEGDILITHATTVDYLPAMKRAAAFVTEVGGLTCHAAVVAREFGVPCVVGLKNATKNFKDGEKAEVNADKGIVRRVK